MTKTHLIARVSELTDTTKKQSEIAVEAVFAAISESLAAGNSVNIFGFGSFKVRHRGARTGRNPLTGKPLKIAATSNVGFKCSKSMRDALSSKSRKK